jgi:hypothetical protein
MFDFRSAKTLFRITAQGVAVAAIAITMSACSAQQFNVESQNQSFGEKVIYSTQVDVLWVIDTSSSMDVHQNLLAKQVGIFVDGLNATQLDYQMAVTTMDMSASGERGKFIGTPSIINSQTPNLTSVLGQRLQVGGNGSQLERGLQGMQSALSSPLSTGLNKGFLRPNSLLVVIFLSDEDDQSAPADYGKFLDQIRPPLASGERSWVAHFMGVIPNDPSCLTSQWHYSSPGLAYIALAKESDGVSQSICSADFVGALTNVKARVLEYVTEYKLDKAPLTTSIKVYVDGLLVPQNDTNGWSYYQIGNSIRFHGTAVPKPGSLIDVKFTPAQLGS